MKTTKDYDIAIIGAGPSGLSFAKALDGSGLKIALIEMQSEDKIAEPSYDGREIALTHLTKKIMSDLGQWDLIAEEEISLIKHAKVLDGTSPYALSFSQKECGKENLGFMLSNHIIRKAAYEAVKGCNNVEFLFGGGVEDIKDNKLKLSDGSYISAKLVVAADSRFSKTRNMMGIKTSMFSYGRDCIVCKMKYEGDAIETAYECFHYDRTLAVLPLNDNHCSVVITVDSSKSYEVLDMSPEDFAKDIQERMQGNAELKNLSLESELFNYPLVGVYAHKFVAPRYALIGDAAVGMHPVTAHGFNLGIRGANILADEIKNAINLGGDYTSPSVLERYNKKHQRICKPLYHGTNALVSLYTKQGKAAKLARRALLHVGNILPPAKRLIMNQLTQTNEAEE